MVDVKQVNVDSYGFEWPKNYDYTVYQTFMLKYTNILGRRTSKWDALMKSKDGFRRSNKVKRYIRKGVPTPIRSAIWMKSSEAEQLREERPDLYQTVLKGPFKPDVVETITLDIPRTFPDNIYFKDSSPTSKKHSLYNVLLAFAHQNPQIGYCQGLNFIAGIMLLVTNSEDTTFWLLQSLVEKILPDYYTKQMTGLLTDIGVLEELVRSKIPEVHEHMVQTGVSWSMYVSKWFICLFAEVLPVETVLRIWDSLFYEGSKILLRVAVTLVVQNKDKILAANNFVEITEVFKSLPFGYNVTDCHSFMQAIFRAPGSFPRAHILKLREYCREKVEKEQQATQVLQEQQRQRQAQEKQAREDALEKQRQAEFEAKQQILKEAVNSIEVDSETESGCGVDDRNVRKPTESFEADASKNETMNVIRINNDNDENFSTAAESYMQKDDGGNVKRCGETTESIQTTGQVGDKVAIEVNILGKQESLVNGEPLQSNGKISPSQKNSEGNGLHV